MSSESGHLCLRAAWVLPVAGEPISDGMVRIQDGKIAVVGPNEPSRDAIDLGDVALVPGFVNAHTHLEFSSLAAPLGRPGMSLPDWIREVLSHRRAEQTSDSLSAVQSGILQSLAGGATSIGEIATSDWALQPGDTLAAPRTTVFRECIAPTSDRVEATLQTVTAFLAQASRDPRFQFALSPHAPYTVHPLLLTGLVDLAYRSKVPLAMHLAESREELELIEHGRGAFRDLLEAVGAFDPSAAARYSSISEYLTQLARAPRSLVVHGNYLLPPGIAFLAEHRASMSVVYCARTHAYFGHAPYPLAERLAAGVATALGTDSRASNPDLDMLNEMRFVAEHHPAVSPATVLELGTVAGARALGRGHEAGMLESGKLADLVAVGPIAPGTRDPFGAIFAAETHVQQVWLAGRPVKLVTR
jgi:cytosine/adenosine deaminase-related metal-dependent hydrolase